MTAQGASAFIPISALDLVLAAALVLMAGAVSLGLRLGLEQRLAWASLRTVLQLGIVGYVLRFVFQAESGWLLSAVVLVMLAAGADAAVRRSTRGYPGVLPAGFLALTASGLVTSFVVTAVVIGVEPWYRPQYLVPLLGMILGNGLTGISLCLDSLLEMFDERAPRIEMELSLGATAWEASRPLVAEAVRKGMIPIINSMTVVGIVSLPGMMTGQILAGADPLEAVKYQIVVMFMLAAATSAGCMLVALQAFRSLFNERHQLLRARIWRRE